MNKEFLITDCIGNASLVLMESTKSGRCKFFGKFQEADTVNKNKRLYPMHILKSSVERLEESIANRNLIMELDHSNDSTLRYENAAAICTKLWWEDNILMGEGEILNTPNGAIVKSLFEANISPGVSSRGIGNGETRPDGVMVIGESYRLCAFDFVCDASTRNASARPMPDYIHTESKIPVLKNESANINKVNVNTLISYFGHLVDNKSQLIRERIKND